MKRLPLMKATLGLNNKEDQVRLYSKDGLVEMSATSNIVVDNRGRPNRRKGSSLAQSGVFHSLYCAGESCVVVKDGDSNATLHEVASDLSLSASLAILTVAQRVCFWQHASHIYYSNGTERGYIKDSVSSAWPTQTHNAPTNRDYASMPVGTHLAVHDGRMLMGVGSALYFSEKFKFNLVDKARMFIQLPSNIRMIAPVTGGVFLSDQYKTYFFKGKQPLAMQEIIVAQYPAHEWSLAHNSIEQLDIGMQTPGMCRVWSSPEGVCLGLADGTFINLTKERVEFETEYTKGATLVWDSVFGIQAIASQY